LVTEGPTGDADVEVVAELGADVFDEICGVVEAPLLLLPVCSQWVWRYSRTSDRVNTLLH